MYDSQTNIPSMGDPSWRARVAPLRAFLATRRTWPELDAWRRERKVTHFMLRCMLAWLSFHKLADAQPSTDGWAWCARRAVKSLPQDNVEVAVDLGTQEDAASERG